MLAWFWPFLAGWWLSGSRVEHHYHNSSSSSSPKDESSEDEQKTQWKLVDEAVKAVRVHKGLYARWDSWSDDWIKGGDCTSLCLNAKGMFRRSAGCYDALTILIGKDDLRTLKVSCMKDCAYLAWKSCEERVYGDSWMEYFEETKKVILDTLVLISEKEKTTCDTSTSATK